MDNKLNREGYYTEVGDLYKRGLTDLTPINPRIIFAINTSSKVWNRPSTTPTISAVDAEGMFRFSPFFNMLSSSDSHSVLLLTVTSDDYAKKINYDQIILYIYIVDFIKMEIILLMLLFFSPSSFAGLGSDSDVCSFGSSCMAAEPFSTSIWEPSTHLADAFFSLWIVSSSATNEVVMLTSGNIKTFAT